MVSVFLMVSVCFWWYHTVPDGSSLFLISLLWILVSVPDLQSDLPPPPPDLLPPQQYHNYGVEPAQQPQVQYMDLATDKMPFVSAASASLKDVRLSCFSSLFFSSPYINFGRGESFSVVHTPYSVSVSPSPCLCVSLCLSLPVPLLLCLLLSFSVSLAPSLSLSILLCHCLSLSLYLPF